MKKITLALAAAGLFLAMAGHQIQAAPAAGVDVTPLSNIVHVADRCGIGWHGNRRGRCVRNRSPRWPCWWHYNRRGRLVMSCHRR